MKINNKIINYRNIILVLLIFQIFISTIIIEATMNPHVDKTNFFTNTTKSSPISADISGNELYAEQITINIAGKNSLIKHSFLTNDTNIFNKIDFSDPSFDGCSFMFSISNDIHPKLDPNPSSNNEIQTIKLSYGSLSGFLYYDINSDYELMNIKKSRLINILKDVFEVDLIFHNEIENKTLGYYYPFYGVIPNIHNFFDITLSKIPKDGYWGSFNLDRILSENYLNNNHLSSSIIFLNQYNLSQSQLNNISKDIDINFDTTPLESSNSLFDLGVNTDNGIGISENTMKILIFKKKKRIPKMIIHI